MWSFASPFQSVDQIGTEKQTTTYSWDLGNRPAKTVIERGSARAESTFKFGWLGQRLFDRVDFLSRNSVLSELDKWTFDTFGELVVYENLAVDSHGAETKQLTKNYTYDPAGRLVAVRIIKPVGSLASDDGDE